MNERAARVLRREPQAMIWVAIGVEVVCASLIAFGDVGFDHRGALGLDFEHLPVLARLWLFAALVAWRWARRLRSATPLKVWSVVTLSGFVAMLLAAGR